MQGNRKIKKIFTPQPAIEGSGVRLFRVFGHNESPMLDPFLMLDNFQSSTPQDYLSGFPWHPHRGIETITYVLKGKVEHGDSLGNKGIISSGDVQWMTAGSGIIHQEMPKGDDQGYMHGFQLWANLPAAQKMINPKYRDITADQVPSIEVQNGIRLKVIAGAIADVRGPVDDIVIDPEFFDCSVPVDETFRHRTDTTYTAFIYTIAGKAEIDGTQIDTGKLVLFNHGEQLSVKAVDEPLRFLLLSGKPLHEPVAWQGPIVMNTQAELETAFQEYWNGTFIKNK